MNRPAGRVRTVWRRVDGLLLLDKPQGLTSNGALQVVRRLLRAEKAGHTGALDPMATGILPLCFGEATKVAGLLLDADKAYRATLQLGERTSTADREGTVVETAAVPPLNEAAVRATLTRFEGAQTQVPPMYSALKRDGEALYEIARRGETVEREPRPIRIDALQLVSLEATALTFDVVCSKGTYIRTLGEDIAVALGSVGHLTALRRTGVGSVFAGFAVHPLQALEALRGDEAALDALLVPPDRALTNYPAVNLSVEQAQRFCHGQALEGLAADGLVCVYDAAGRFLGLGEGSHGLLAPKRLFH